VQIHLKESLPDQLTLRLQGGNLNSKRAFLAYSPQLKKTLRYGRRGLDVVDFSMRQRIRRWVDFNFSVDNLLDKHYFETQNFLESRISPIAPIVAQIHGTPGYSRGVTAGLTFHLFGKEK
jgi:outer membrane receptor protein involved in Fe transport